MAENDVVITIENLSKTFNIYEDRKDTLKSLFASFFNQGKTRKYKALDNINLKVNRGDFIGILGRNGSGKSTLLKIIAGIYNTDRGSKVDYLGKLVPFLELGVGFNPDLTGKENVFLNGTILGMTHESLKKHLDEIVEFAELKDFINMPIKNYSSGMIIRLAFSIAMQSNADIFLLDEIFAVGDAHFQQKSIEVIQKLKDQGKTIVHITHDLYSVLQHCNRAVLMDHGHILADGDPTTVVEQYKQLIGA